MPLIDGIGLVGDKHAVVLDIGSAYTKCGFASEFAPRFIIPSTLIDPVTETITNVVDYNRKTDEAFEILIEFLQQIYYKHLLVSPKERRVVIVESVLCPTTFRQLLARIFLSHYECPSIVFVPAHLMGCFAIGSQNALVIDVGYHESLVMPIFEGVPMLNAWQAAPLGARAVHENLVKLIKSCKISTAAGETRIEDCPDILITDKIIEDIKGAPPNPPSDVDYPIDGNKIIHIPGGVREAAFEVLFEPDADQKALPNLLLDALLRIPIDLRRPLAEKILIIGGSAMIQGFTARLKAELLDLLGSPRYHSRMPLKQVKFYRSPSKPNYTAWLGGSIFGALEVLPHRSISKEQYAEKSTIPDWTTFAGRYESSTESDAPQR